MKKHTVKLIAFAMTLCLSLSAIPATTVVAADSIDTQNATNLVQNGSFEQVDSGVQQSWTEHIGSVAVDAITYSENGALFTGTVADSELVLTQEITVSAGDTNRFSGKVQITEGTPDVFLQVTYYDANGNQAGQVQAADCSAELSDYDDAFTEVHNDNGCTVPDGAVKAIISLGMRGIGKCLWDDVSFMAAQKISDTSIHATLHNGSFEALNTESGMPENWTVNGATEATDGVLVQKNSKVFWQDASVSNKQVRHYNASKLSADSYTITGKLKVMTQGTTPYVRMGGGGSVSTLPLSTTKAALGEWYNFNVTLSTSTDNYIVLASQYTNSGGLCFWDDIKVFQNNVELTTFTNGNFESQRTNGTPSNWSDQDPTYNLVSGTHYGISDTIIDDPSTEAVEIYAPVLSGTAETSDVSLVSDKVSVSAGATVSFSAALQVYEKLATSDPYITVHYYGVDGNMLKDDNDNAITHTADCSGKKIGDWVTISSTEGLTAPKDAASATITVGQKNIGKCLWDAVTFSATGGNSFTEKLVNGNFAADLSGWTPAVAQTKQDSISIIEDNAVLMLNALSGQQTVTQTLKNLEASTSYRIKADILKMSDNAQPMLDLYMYYQTETTTGYKTYARKNSIDHGPLQGNITTGEWSKITFDFTISDNYNGNTLLHIRGRNTGTAGADAAICYWDNVEIYKLENDAITGENKLSDSTFSGQSTTEGSKWSYTATANTNVVTEGMVADGVHSALFTGTQPASDVALYQEIPVTAGTAYTFSAQTLPQKGSTPYLTIAYKDAAGNPVGEAIRKTVAAENTPVNTWTALSDRITAPDGAVNAVITVGQTGIGQSIWDAVSMRELLILENKLVNGTFETLNVAGYPAAWIASSNVTYGTNAFTETLEPSDATGTSASDHALKLVNANNASMKIQQMAGNDIKADQSYTFSAKIKVLANNGGREQNAEGSTIDTNVKALLDIYPLDANGSTLTYTDTAGTVKTRRIVKYFTDQLDLTNTEDWQEVSCTITTPADTAVLNFSLGCQGKGEILWNDVMLVEGTNLPDELTIGTIEQLSTEFRNMLAEEASRATAEEGKIRNELHAYDKAFGSNSTTENASYNLLQNADFEANSGTNTLESWNLQTQFSKYATVVADGGDEGIGDDCIRFYVPEEDSLQNPFYDQWVDVVGGAEYQISYKYKLEGGGASANPTIKVECWTDTSLPGASYIMGTYATAGSSSEALGNGWYRYTKKIYPSSNVEEMQVLVRSLAQSVNKDETAVYIDDVEIVMTQAPAPLTLTTDEIFYYSDVASVTGAAGTAVTNINMTYYPELANAKIELKLRDTYAEAGTNDILWSTTYQCTNGTGSASFPLSLLTQNDLPYEIIATLYDVNGTIVKQVDVQNIYVTDRPTNLGADGIYRYKVYDTATGTYTDETKEFYPEYAYHVSRSATDQYAKLQETGINLVQMGSFSNAASAVSTLDAALEAGIKGFIALYNGMKPAGDDSNIENTIAIIEAVKDHPALFGYGVMDEVFLQLTDPEDELEASYRLIRSLDPNHPIMTMEAVDNFYEVSGKYVDILCIDPYSSASSQHVAQAAAKAVEAVHNQKPVYALLEAYRNTHGKFPTPNDLRNNIWQALIKDTNAVGYYSITDSEIDDATGKWDIPIWNAKDGGALWQAICDFNTYEKQIAYDHFVFDQSEVYTESAEIGNPYWYSSWKVDNTDGSQDYYMVVLSMLEDAEATQEVSIPLNKDGDAAYGRFNATALSGRINENGVGEIVAGEDTLEMTLQGWEAVLFKIESAEALDVKLSMFDESGAVIDAKTAEDEPVSPIGAGEYTINEAVTVTAPITENYNFNGWYAGETDESGAVTGFTGDALTAEPEYTFTVTTDTNLAAVYKAIAVEENSDGVADSYRLNSDGTAVIQADTENLTGLQVDSAAVEKSKYTVNTEAGTITLDKAYIENLAAGSHTVTLIYTGGYTKTILEIVEALDIIEDKSDLTFILAAEGDGISIYCNGEFEKFISVEVDSNVISSENYTVKEGSTILTFTPAYLNTLSAGAHTVKLNYTDGSAVTSIMLSEKEAASDTDTNQNDGQGNQGNTDSNAGNASVNVGSNSNDTGDHSNLMLWLGLLTAFTLIGILLITILKKRTK